MRLTDQALVAVKIARAQAAARHGSPTAVDLLVGMLVESDGAAGHLLRTRSTAAADLAGAQPSPGATALDAVLVEAAAGAAPRPAATLDLLYALLDVGGEPVASLLQQSGWEPADLHAVPPGPAGETLGLRGEPGLTPPAQAAVARARAGGGGAVDLLYELEAGPDADSLGLELPLARPASTPQTDAGVDAVVDAARAFRREGAVTSTDLVRACLLVGGAAPRTLLETD